VAVDVGAITHDVHTTTRDLSVPAWTEGRARRAGGLRRARPDGTHLVDRNGSAHDGLIVTGEVLDAIWRIGF
jgi:hypothetical protein